MILSAELRDAHSEIRSLRLKTTQLEHEIGQLKDNIHLATVQNSLDVILSRDDKIMDINFDHDIDYVADKAKELNNTSIKVKTCAQNIDFSRLSQRLKCDDTDNPFALDDCVKIRTTECKKEVENKENEGGNLADETEQCLRKVTFSESVNESKVESRVPRRLGAKVLKPKQVINVCDLFKK